MNPSPWLHGRVARFARATPRSFAGETRPGRHEGRRRRVRRPGNSRQSPSNSMYSALCSWSRARSDSLTDFTITAPRRLAAPSNAVGVDQVLGRSRDDRILQWVLPTATFRRVIPSPHCTALGHLSSWCRISIKALSGTGRPETAPAKSVEAVGRPARSCASCRACAEPMKVRCSSAALSISRTGECRSGHRRHAPARVVAGGVRFGTIDITINSGSALESLVPAVDALQLPF